MSDSIELQLEKSFEWIVHQLTKGNTIEGLRNNTIFFEFEQVREWKSKYGFQFHIYSNDHFIDNKPHFHLVKKSEDIDCRIFFDGSIYDCKGKAQLDRKAQDAVVYFLEGSGIQKLLITLWNNKNPGLTLN